MPDKKTQKAPKKQKSISGLLAKLDALEKKLNLLNTMGKTMPVMILVTGALLGSLVYLSQTATIPETTSTLPETGDEITLTEDFIILYPEYLSSITLPNEVVGLNISGYFTSNEKVTFYAQNSSGEETEIGEGVAGDESGEYKTTWESAEAGTYTLWAEIETESGTKVKSASITVTIQ